LYLFTHFEADLLEILKSLAICEIVLLPFPQLRITSIRFFSLKCFPEGIAVQGLTIKTYILEDAKLQVLGLYGKVKAS
jgi:hypothetical protein